MRFPLTVAFALFTLASTSIAPATAETQDEQSACMNDAFTVCGRAIPDRDRVAACLTQNINRISVACRTVMLRYSKPATQPAQRVRVMSARD